MKKYLLLIIAALAIFGVSAQDLSKSELKKIEKEAKKQAQAYIKEGWKTLPGKPSIQMQQEKAVKMSYEKNASGEDKYIMQPGQASGQTYNAARLGAIQGAKMELANSLGQTYFGNMTNDLSNDGVLDISVEEVKSEVKSIIDQKLGKIITVSEMYQQSGPKKFVVAVMVAYNSEEAEMIAKEAAREVLKRETQNLGK